MHWMAISASSERAALGDSVTDPFGSVIVSCTFELLFE